MIHRFAVASLWVFLLSAMGCENVSMPRLVNPPTPLPTLPMSVTLAFDDTVRDARLEAEACGAQWEGPLGHALVTSFLDTSRQSFARVQAAGVSEPQAVTDPALNHLGIQVSLLDQSFKRRTAFGEEDTYTAQLRVALLAVVSDRQGTPIGKVPLTYDESVNIFTPDVSGDSATCLTESLDGAMQTAADDLARQMVLAVSQWASGSQPQAQPGFAGAAPAPPARTPPAGIGNLAVKATLLDENDNLILEAGERIGVRIDATNTGQSPLPASSITLSGTSALIDAFAVAAGTTSIGPLQPGETKSSVLWGRLAEGVEAQRGELVVSVVAMGATTSQTLVAAIRPTGAAGVAPGATAAPSSARGLNAPAGQPPAATALNRRAVLVNIKQYRTAWDGADAGRSDKFPHLVRVLRTAGGLSRHQVLVLADRRATRADLEEGLLKWLPSKITPDSVVLVYISTQAVTDDRTGEIYLIPYEGTPKGPKGSLVSLEALQGTLKRTNARLCLLLIDAPLTAGNGSKSASGWQGLINAATGSGARLVQVVSSSPSLRLDQLLVLGLEGQADADEDKQVTLGELLDYLKVGGQIYPSLPASAPERAIPLTG